MKTTSLRVLAALSSVAVFALGCESASEGNSSLNVPVAAKPAATTAASTASATQNTSASGKPTPSQPSEPASPTPAPTPSPATPAAGDQVPYGSLRWSYGGISAGGAANSGVAISGLRMSSNSLSFKYNTDLSAWGYSAGDAKAYACMFVQNDSGAWVGGKFDWISSSRSSRDLNNVRSGYGGWNLANVPNPCQVAFVIVDGGKKRRSNVIVGTWRR